MKRKIRNLVRKILPFVLVGIITSSAVMLSYNECRDVKAVAVVDDVAIASTVALILLAYGYLSINCFNDTDGTSALAKSWEEAYDKERLTVLQGGAGAGGDNNDDDDDWEDIDGDGKITEVDIPKWVDVVAGFGATGAVVSLMANADKILSPIVSEYIFNDGVSNKNTCEDIQRINSEFSAARSYMTDRGIDLSSYPYYLIQVKVYDSSNEIDMFYAKSGFRDTSLPWSMSLFDFQHVSLKTFNNGRSPIYRLSSGPNIGIGLSYKSCNYLSCNVPFGSDVNSSKPIIWTTPELQKSFDNNKTLSLQPAFDPLASYDIPTQQALQNLMSTLYPMNGISAADQQDLVNKFIESLKKESAPEPEPKPEPEPEPNPEPEPEPNPEPSEDNADLLADLKHLFPFCVPFDLVDCFKLFNAEPVTPRVEFPIHFGIVEKDYTFVIDLEDFNGVAKVCRLMFLIGFIVSLVYATRQLIRG